MQRLLIITPVYDDWISFGRLLQEIEAEFPDDRYTVQVIAVDDCSSTDSHCPTLGGSIARVEVIRLTLNVGHQRAIAIGLVEAESINQLERVIVMDSDGEDLPSELKRMVDAAQGSPEISIVGQRRRRSESWSFRLFYAIYLRIFQMFTGHRIDFGNFSVLTAGHARRLIHSPHIWNNYAGTVLHTKIPIIRIPTARGSRYAGKPRMRFIGLVAHGLGAISVFSDSVFIRILIASLFVFALSSVSAIVVIGIRLFSDLAIPGWATNVLGFSILISAQAVMLPILIAFLTLSARSSFQNSPKDYAHRLIEARYTLYERAIG